MITLKYKKEGPAIFVSHIDLLKQFIKIINRSKIDIEFSKGFHPHMQIYCTTPLPVGVSSEAEFITIYTNENSIIDRLNKTSIGGLSFTEEYVVKENPKLTANIDKASYLIKCDLSNIEVEKIKEFLSHDSIKINTLRKGEMTEVEVKPLIYDYEILNNEITCTLACGNPNLRIDYLIKKINEEIGTSIKITASRKMNQYMTNTGEKVEDYLETLKV